jgi:hypothetical protein
MSEPWRHSRMSSQSAARQNRILSPIAFVRLFVALELPAGGNEPVFRTI